MSLTRLESPEGGQFYLFQMPLSRAAFHWAVWPDEGHAMAMGLIQAEDKEILAACDFNKAQNNSKSSNKFFPFMNRAYKSIHK